jgi:SSS family solute:Na+ symporter
MAILAIVFAGTLSDAFDGVFVGALFGSRLIQAAESPSSGTIQSSDTIQPSETDQLRERSLAILRQTLQQEERWVKVHAAEELLALGYPEGVQETFLEELKQHGDEPQYRIGIWRVLAKAAHQESEHKEWVEKIRNVLFDPNAPDRVHAAETLAKFPYSLESKEIPLAEEASRSETVSLAVFAMCILANAQQANAETRLADWLNASDESIRTDAAYSLRHLAGISSATQEKLRAAVEREPKESKSRAYFVAALAVHLPVCERGALKAELAAFAVQADRDARTESLHVLAKIADDGDRPMLKQLLDDPDADVRSAAADALLHIERRAPHHLTGWDWTVIALYALLMLSIGWYFSRRTKTQEQYLLGDRKMRPLMVGISLFASLISIVSYLAEPGEIIKNGPTYLIASFLAYPIVYLIVGWFMIPFIMRLKVTSAYEILELRLGPGVRTLGSLFFLSLRLTWMSVIVYAASSKVLIPMLGLDPSVTPLICAILAFVTIIYTSMGGVRAVVITDVIQTAILFGAAIITIVSVSYCLGGVHAWWPQHWLEHWPE